MNDKKEDFDPSGQNQYLFQIVFGGRARDSFMHEFNEMQADMADMMLEASELADAKAVLTKIMAM